MCYELSRSDHPVKSYSISKFNTILAPPCILGAGEGVILIFPLLWYCLTVFNTKHENYASAAPSTAS
jgi:hypothetical protein